MKKVYAIVLTMNRKQLLLECIEALKQQSRAVTQIVIVDNNSTDGTPQLVAEHYRHDRRVTYLRLPTNVGPAGGFNEGIKHAYAQGADWMWLLDDDCEPTPDALRNLLAAQTYLETKKEKPGLLASTVFSPKGEIMNVPKISTKIGPTGEFSAPQHLPLSLLQIDNATFVSVMYSRDFVKHYGYPIADMFIWGDDTEYSYRASSKYPSYMVGNSIVIHKKQTGKITTIFEETNKATVHLYYRYFKNNMYAIKRYETAYHFTRTLVNWLTYKPLRCLFSRPYGIQKAYAVFFGTLHGLFYNPIIEKPSD